MHHESNPVPPSPRTLLTVVPCLGEPGPDDVLSIDVVTAIPGGQRTLHVHGEVDTSTSILLEGCLDLQIRTAGGVEVVVDLTAVTFLGARGLRALAAGCARAAEAGVDLRVRCGRSRAVLRPLQLTGLLEVLPQVD